MPAPYSFLRPLLAPNRAWTALDWQINSTNAIEGSAITRRFADSGATSLAAKMPFVLPVDPAWLGQSEFIQKFVANQVIFVLPPDTLDDAATLAQCQELRKKGFHCALRVEKAANIRRIPLPAFDHLEFTADFAQQQLPVLDLIYTRQAGFRRIVSAVDSYERFDWLAAKHVELCASRFVTGQPPASGKGGDLVRLKLLKLLSLVAQDADTHEIEEVFREEPKLSYDLLRLVNSVAVGAKTTIGSFRQAIAILGRRQLQRWLQLLIYANPLTQNEPNPLLQLAAARGRQMELLAGAIEPMVDAPDFGDTAFMTGIFSLLDVLLNLPMSKVLDVLPLHESIHRALNSQEGILGQLLSAIVAGESGDFLAATETLAKIGISPANHAKAQTAAFFWASGINLD